MLLDSAPTWLIGPALASLLAAYMSTVDTHLNWSASYLINDCYMPYISPGRSDKHYVRASYIATVGIALAGVLMTGIMESIVEGWGLIAGLLSGMGIVGILRWLWWRVTAWTELGCMLSAGAATLVIDQWFSTVKFPETLLYIVPVSLLGAVIGTFAFAPEPRQLLFDFYQSTEPRPVPEVAKQPVVIVDIDDKSLAAIGQWPWLRRPVIHGGGVGARRDV